MINRRMLMIGLAGTLGACSNARENAGLKFLGVFGREPEKAADGTIIDPRVLVDQVLSVRVERNQGGAILHATGLPPQQGYYAGELLVQNGGVPEKGVLTFEFRVIPPPKPTRVSTQASREILVGLYLSNQQLADVRRIRVIAAQNSRTVSRR